MQQRNIIWVVNTFADSQQPRMRNYLHPFDRSNLNAGKPGYSHVPRFSMHTRNSYTKERGRITKNVNRKGHLTRNSASEETTYRCCSPKARGFIPRFCDNDIKHNLTHVRTARPWYNVAKNNTALPSRDMELFRTPLYFFYPCGTFWYHATFRFSTNFVNVSHLRAPEIR